MPIAKNVGNASPMRDVMRTYANRKPEVTDVFPVGKAPRKPKWSQFGRLLSAVAENYCLPRSRLSRVICRLSRAVWGPPRRFAPPRVDGISPVGWNNETEGMTE